MAKKIISKGRLFIEVPYKGEMVFMPLGDGGQRETGITPEGAENLGGYTGFKQIPFNINIAKEAAETQNYPTGQNTGQQGAGGFTGVNTGHPVTEELFGEIQKNFKNTEALGNAVNPNVEITQERVAEFLSKAEKEVAPYFASQFKLAKENLLYNLGYAETEIDIKEKEFEQDYRKSLRNLSDTLAERGLASSGQRAERERELASDTQRRIDEPRRAFTQQAGQAHRQFAQQYGEEGYRGLGESTQVNAPQVLPGQRNFQRPTSRSPVYELPQNIYSGLIGSQQTERHTSIQNRADYLQNRESERRLEGQQKKFNNPRRL